MNYSATPEFMVNTAQSSYKMPSMHYHSSYELYYLEMGSREYFVEDRLFSVCAGDFVLIPPSMLHRTGGEYGERTLISFTDSFLEKVYSKEAISHLLQCFSHVKVTPQKSQQEICKSLLRRIMACQNETESALLLGLLLVELSKCDTHAVENDFVSNIVSYINKNFAAIDNISQIADHFYISKFHLCRIFKAAMKLTVVEYLNQVRIRNACQMLDYSSRDIGEISDACGYHSVTYFSNIFKKTMGESPTEYRKRIKG